MLARLGLLQIVLVALTMGIAAQRNRNPAGWALAALFFPLVALLVLLALPPVPKQPASFRADTGPLPVCNRCGRVSTEPAARFCAGCGASL